MSFLKRPKTLTIFIILLLGIGYSRQCLAQTAGTNYVRTRVPQIPVTDTSRLDTIPVQRQAVNIRYSDALGRTSQSIQLQASPGKMDMITPYFYDDMGRAVTSFMPYPDEGTTSSTTGQFRDMAVDGSINFYSPFIPGAAKIPRDIAPYAQTVYEASPLGRVMEQGSVGSNFQPGTNHTLRASYQVSSDTDRINHYIVTNGAVSIISQYNPGVLTKAVVTDANGHRTAIWQDLQGKTVTSSQLDVPTPYYSTDYVYNDLDQVIGIVTPLAKKQIANPTATFQTIFGKQSYTFHYDSVGRIVEKKIPDKGWIYTLYNHSDLPVLTQDSNMRVKNQWMYIKYDAEGRIVQTGIYTNTAVTSRKALQQLCDTSAAWWETWQPGTGYTNNAFPQQSMLPGAAPLLVYINYYYDDYSFSEAAAKPFQSNIYGNTPTQRTMGKLTGTSVYVLGTANQRLVTVNYYDIRNRLIQQIGDNHLGFVDVVNSQYNFVGELTGSQRITVPLAANTATLKDRYTYDHLGRLMATYESLNGRAEIDISHNVYNEIGQKVSEGLHSVNGDTSFAQTQEFRYSIRGELTNINNGTLTYDNGVTQSDTNALFGETITYDQPALPGATPQYTGNISTITWRNKIEQSGLPGITTGGQGYSFTYDNANRLTGSRYYTQTDSTFTLSPTGALAETVRGYDEMGNMDTLRRTDKNGNLLNNLTYTYQSSGNQLQSVSDTGSQNISSTFTYDGNGNMTGDSRKGITITYNYLDLPDTVKQGNNKLVFTYDAAGNKLYKQLIVGGTVTSQRHYVEEIELTSASAAFSGLQVESIAMDEGRIVNTGSGNYQYEYNLQDHLYSNRVTFRPEANGSLTLTQVQNYYPFGLEMGDATMNYTATPQNLYQYNGKEWQPELNLNTYDFGARHYDPALGRWTAIDPLAEESEELSPYNYVENNPMNLMDPDGMQPSGGNDTVLGQASSYITGDDPVSAASSAGGSWWSTAGGITGAAVTGVFGFHSAQGAFNIQNAKVISQSWRGISELQQNQVHVNTNAGANQTKNSGYTEQQILSAHALYYGGDYSGSFMDNLNYYVYKFNHTFNPISFAVDAYYGYTASKDVMGNPQGPIQTNVNAAFAMFPLSGEFKGALGIAEENTYSVYQGFDEAGNVKYVGITKRIAKVRFAEHEASGTAKALLRYRVIDGAIGLSKTEARVWEQTLINSYGLKNLLNVRNSIAPAGWSIFGIQP